MAKIDSTSPDDFKTFVRFLCCKEFLSNRDNLYALMDDNENLKYRIFTYSEHFKTVKRINRLLNNHTQKVRWHIRRIYRARNLIVHNGGAPSSINVLVENLHCYLDLFLNQLIDFVVDDFQVKSIDQSIKEVTLINEQRKKVYEEDLNIEINDENFEKYIIENSG